MSTGNYNDYPPFAFDAKCPDCGFKYMNVYAHGAVHCGSCGMGGAIAPHNKYSDLLIRLDEYLGKEDKLMAPIQTPSIGRVVHYVGYGTPKGEYGQECRAAIITEVIDENTVMLFIMNPKGVFFTESKLDEEGKAGGTWHWPERV